MATNHTDTYVTAHRYVDSENPATGAPERLHVGSVQVAPGDDFPDDVDVDRLDPAIFEEPDEDGQVVQAAGPGQSSYFDPSNPDEFPGDAPASLATSDSGTQVGSVGQPIESLTVPQLRVELDAAAAAGADGAEYSQSEKKADLVDRLREVRGLLVPDTNDVEG